MKANMHGKSKTRRQQEKDKVVEKIGLYVHLDTTLPVPSNNNNK